MVAGRFADRVHLGRRKLALNTETGVVDNWQQLNDLFSVRPDGTGLRRLTRDTEGPVGTTAPVEFGARFATWTRGGRIVFMRGMRGDRDQAGRCGSWTRRRQSEAARPVGRGGADGGRLRRVSVSANGPDHHLPNKGVLGTGSPVTRRIAIAALPGNRGLPAGCQPPRPAPSAEAASIVGEWVGVHDCERIVTLLQRGGS